jgi:hypothetical protein
MDDVPAERLVELLDYVSQVIRLDERPAFRLSEHRLANGQSFIFHQHELHSLPGITHDLVDEDGAVWLCAERLKRNGPPPPSETLAPWLELTPDPDRTPQPRDHILLTVPKPECDELVAAGQARAEDCAESLATDAKGQFDVRLRLEDRPCIAAEAEQYATLSCCRGRSLSGPGAALLRSTRSFSRSSNCRSWEARNRPSSSCGA